MKGYKHLSPEQREEILRLYAIPTPTSEIARAVGASEQQVLRAIHQAGLDRHRMKPGACQQHDALLRQMALAGLSLSEMARRIGTTRHRVAEYLTRYNIPRTPFVQVGESNPSWKGGRMMETKPGRTSYWLIYRPDHPFANRHGYVREHRLVMEQMLGRYLTRKEVVDHIDRDGLNNDPSNLRLFPTNAEHLAATLAGAHRRPDHLREPRIPEQSPPHSASRPESASGDQPSPSPNGPMPA